MTAEVSVICTTFNEEKTIIKLLDALCSQTLKPREIIICDGGSWDNTQFLIENYARQHPLANISLISKQGNRSIGRNAAIKKTHSSVIAITDAGCIPEKNWLKELWNEYTKSGALIVAGYYKGLPQTPFEEAVVPYALVMPDKVNPKKFLPATRSVLLEKKIWEAVGGFDEKLSLNEDYAFAQKIKSKGFEIAFARKAVVGWVPRKNVKEFWVMIERFAQGDIQAGLIRPKVVFIFFRYVALVMLLVLMSFVSRWQEIVSLILVLFVLYSYWAVSKNGSYVKKGWYWLPVLQYISDLAVMKGSLQGLKN